MKYLIVEPFVKAIAPNIALMKWARWCELNDHQYQYVRGIVTPDIEPDKILMSCIFTYDAKIYEKTIKNYWKLFPHAELTVGGVFPTLNKKWFDQLSQNLGKHIIVHQRIHTDIEPLIPKYNVEIKSEKDDPEYRRDTVVLYASRGCVNKCSYCAVPGLEGKMRSFKSIADTLLVGRNEINSRNAVLYDNNFTEHQYFKEIVQELKTHRMLVDIHGLHVESFTEEHARNLNMLDWAPQKKNGTPYIRFSFDKKSYRNAIENALELVKNYQIKAAFFCYMLFNDQDTPDDFWWRIEEAQKIVDKVGQSIFLFPQRFEPFISLKRNSYISPNWTKEIVVGLTRIYTHTRGFIPITRERSIYRWIGNTKNEFFENIKKAYIGQYSAPKIDWESLGILTF
jgi:hypothetical protein